MSERDGADTDGPPTDQRLEREWQDTHANPRGGYRLQALREWVLVGGRRLVVTALLVGIVFALTVVAGMYGPVSVQRFLTRGVSPGATFVELLKTIVSLVTIVLSINQLVLSPQLGSVGEQRSRLDDSMDLRERVEDVVDGPAVAPSAPGLVLRDVVEAIDDRTAALAELDGSEAFRADRDEYVADVREDTRRLLSDLEGARFGEFEVVPSVVAFDISAKVREARGLRRHHRETLGALGRDRLDGLVEVLELFATARAYFKTTYVRSEYIAFSRLLLYLGLPALLFTLYATQVYDDAVFPGATFGVSNRLLFVALTTAVSLSPFALMISYVSRLATISQSTLFIGPFTANQREGDR